MIIYATNETAYDNDEGSSFSGSLSAIIFFLILLALFYFFLTNISERNDAIIENIKDPYFNRDQSTNLRAAKYMSEKTNAAVAANRRRYHIIDYMKSGTNEKQEGENFSMHDVKRAVATVKTNLTGRTPSSGKGQSKVVKVKSNKDGQMYFVASDLPNKSRAADKMAEVQRRSQYLLQSVSEQLDGNKRVKAADGTDITDNMKQLVRRHYQKIIPFAEYHNPDDLTVGSNSDKGMMIEMCLRSKYDPNEWNSDNTLFRVHVHELAHSADFHFRGDGEDAHGPVFKRLHQHLLGIAENLGIYNCAEYKRSGRRLCGLVLGEQYCGT